MNEPQIDDLGDEIKAWKEEHPCAQPLATLEKDDHIVPIAGILQRLDEFETLFVKWESSPALYISMFRCDGKHIYLTKGTKVNFYNVITRMPDLIEAPETKGELVELNTQTYLCSTSSYMEMIIPIFGDPAPDENRTPGQ